jgi:hypothetical protein
VDYHTLFDALTARRDTASARRNFIGLMANACAVARRAAVATLVGAALLGAAGPAVAAQDDLLTPVPCVDAIYCVGLDESALDDRYLYALDSDGDGLSDGDEVNAYGTDPNALDTDGDGYGDGY